MKKLMITMVAVMIAIAANAQYNVGTSSRYTDSYGNSTSTHRNQYLLIETVMVTRSVLRRLIQIRMETPLRLIVIDMVIPQEQTGAIRIVSETPQQLILTLMAKEKARQTPILTASEILPRPIRTVMDKALVLPPAIRIRLGIPLLSSVAIMKTLPSGHGNL